jgi:hypothetical protein
MLPFFLYISFFNDILWLQVDAFHGKVHFVQLEIRLRGKVQVSPFCAVYLKGTASRDFLLIFVIKTKSVLFIWALIA